MVKRALLATEMGSFLRAAARLKLQGPGLFKQVMDRALAGNVYIVTRALSAAADAKLTPGQAKRAKRAIRVRFHATAAKDEASEARVFFVKDDAPFYHIVDVGGWINAQAGKWLKVPLKRDQEYEPGGSYYLGAFIWKHPREGKFFIVRPWQERKGYAKPGRPKGARTQRRGQPKRTVREDLEFLAVLVKRVGPYRRTGWISDTLEDVSPKFEQAVADDVIKHAKDLI